MSIKNVAAECYPYDYSTVNEDGKLLDGSSRYGNARTRLNSALLCQGGSDLGRNSLWKGCSPRYAASRRRVRLPRRTRVPDFHAVPPAANANAAPEIQQDRKREEIERGVMVRGRWRALLESFRAAPLPTSRFLLDNDSPPRLPEHVRRPGTVFASTTQVLP
jgi:hypothetical protein